MTQLQQIMTQTRTAVTELLQQAKLQQGDLFVVGCSSSEVAGHTIGTFSSLEVANALVSAIQPLLYQQGIFLVAQCCEHLNRALILEAQAAERYRLTPVNVVPQPKAGGSFATAAFASMRHPVAVETLQAAAGLDIGDTFIGMHLRPVAVPVRLSISSIGQAHLTAARTRPKYIGGSRAVYDEQLG